MRNTPTENVFTTRTFVLRNFSAIVWPGVLGLVALLVLPFAFRTDSRERLVEIKGRFAAMKVIHGQTEEQNIFEIRLRSEPKVFLIERMRLGDQALFTSREKPGDEVLLTVEEDRLGSAEPEAISVHGISTPNGVYLAPVDYGTIMRANRVISLLVLLGALAGATTLFRGLRRKYHAEMKNPPPPAFDPWLVSIATHPESTARWIVAILYLVLAIILPAGSWPFVLAAVLVAYTWFHFWFRAKRSSFTWMDEALKFAHARGAGRVREQTEAPAYVKKFEPLLKSGADLNALDESGQAFLHKSAAQGSVEEVDYLLRNGVNADTRDAKGQTALMIAASVGSYGVVKKLLERGADPLLKTEAGDTALSLAKKNPKFEAIAKVISKAEAEAEAKAAKATVDDIISKIESSGKPPASGAANGEPA